MTYMRIHVSKKVHSHFPDFVKTISTSISLSYIVFILRFHLSCSQTQILSYVDIIRLSSQRILSKPSKVFDLSPGKCMSEENI